ncbi:SDR family NAD(P)-dependent oxidoreductase [Dactylosporangium sp. NPDC051541]|uniref:SDR family NAD(P)-dependent oxidoreductase n=1 Tax=Dactylosporangium sp. NPDC051541 TaxID=3363977 RepID=UPI0037AFBC18
MTTSIVVGGTGYLGRAVAAHFVQRGDAVYVTGRDKAKAESVAAELGPAVRGLAVDLAEPDSIAAALADVTEVDNLVITASDPTPNTIADFSTAQAIRSITVKLVGYAETVRVLHPRFNPGAAVVLFGGLAKERPYAGSTMVTTFNGGISGLVKTLAHELAPHRVNALHPAIVGDSPKWAPVPVEQQPGALRTPIGRLINTSEVVGAVDFLLSNGGVNAIDLHLDGGFLITN